MSLSLSPGLRGAVPKPAATPEPPDRWSPVLATLACAAPVLLAYSVPPSATLFNQCLAMALWGAWLVWLAPARLLPTAWPALAALGLVAAAAGASSAFGALPRSLALAALASLGTAAAVLAAGAEAAHQRRLAVPRAFFTGLVVAGALSAAVAGVQVFWPAAADGTLIFASSLPGRAIGNLRQPNHLCTLLLWAVIGAVALHDSAAAPGRRAFAALAALVAVLILAVELSASRTGAVGLGLLVAWGLLDRRLHPRTRWLLLATPLLYGLAYAAVAAYGDWSNASVGAGARLAQRGLGDGGSANSRLNIWANAWALLMAHPWTGVGFGEFNLAWSLTAFPGRPTAFFDHTHNLPLQLAVELGLPLALAVLGLLAWALWRAWRASATAPGAAGVLGRAAGVLVAMALLHSLVEYPLWYAYFMLPAAFALGLALGTRPDTAPDRANPAAHQPAHPQAARPHPGPVGTPPAGTARGKGWLLGLAMLLGGGAALADYTLVAVIYAPGDDALPLDERIAAGQGSVFFAHHADYAAATNTMPPAAKALAFARAPHSLVDTRLMAAWAHHLDDRGQTDQARWLAARLREFRNPEAAVFFAPCEAPTAGTPPPFQCQPPERVHSWREFLAPIPSPTSPTSPPPPAPAAAGSGASASAAGPAQRPGASQASASLTQ